MLAVAVALETAPFLVLDDAVAADEESVLDSPMRPTLPLLPMLQLQGQAKDKRRR